MNLEDYDIIGYKIVSPLHMATLLAYASRIKPTEIPMKLLVIVSKGPWERNILDHSAPVPEGIEISYVEESELWLGRSRAWPLYLAAKPLLLALARMMQKPPLPVCSPTMTSVLYSGSSLARACRVSPVILDEGIGSFNCGQIFRQASEQHTASPVLQRALQFCYKTIWNHLKLWGGARVSLFGFIDGRAVIDEEVADSYRSTFLANYKARGADLRLPHNSALILTQPYSEAGTTTEDRACSEEQLIQLVKYMAEEIRLSGCYPVLKLHPVEARNKYACLKLTTLDYDGPAEEIFAACGHSITEVWGFNSTSLILAPSLYGIRAKVVSVDWNLDYLRSLDAEAAVLFRQYTELVATD